MYTSSWGGELLPRQSSLNQYKCGGNSALHSGSSCYTICYYASSWQRKKKVAVGPCEASSCVLMRAKHADRINCNQPLLTLFLSVLSTETDGNNIGVSLKGVINSTYKLQVQEKDALVFSVLEKFRGISIGVPGQHWYRFDIFGSICLWILLVKRIG